MSLGVSRSKVKHEIEEVDSEGSWAISYGDMVTLLLAFFVLFFTVDPVVDKEEQLKESLIMALSIQQKTEIQRSPAQMQQGTGSAKIQEMDLGKEVQFDNLDQNILDQWGARVYTIGKRILIDFPRSNFFGVGQITLNQEGKKLLNNFIERYTPYAGNYILGIRAYTDSRPVTSTGYRYKDNLELSALRAISTMRYLQDKGIPLDRMRLGGHGILRQTDEELKEIREKYNIEDPMAFSRKVVLVIEPEAKKEKS
ncbi:MAG: OmpA family protein [Bdellovibrionales bacterium]|nr:OmpA family protein [Bdellovibrionales bacterium]